MREEPEAGAYHETQGLFREALMKTASETGFSERLIEKDYYCSLLLKDLAKVFGLGLIFKGGTCLSKVHTDFFRLSEDLDFGISLEPNASRAARRRAVEPIKGHLASLAGRLPCFSELEAIAGQNNNKHHKGQVAYRSVLTDESESIKIEISLREELLLASGDGTANTMLIDPLRNERAVEPFAVRVLSIQEVYAEKIRAALTRRDPAIRDFFDLDIAVRKGLFEQGAPEFLSLVSQKLALTEDPVDTSTERLEALGRQIETQLKPVLRSADYEGFALDRVVAALLQILTRCERQ